MIEKFLPQLRRQVGFGIEEKRRNVILQRALASALVIHEIGLSITQHNVSGLKVAIEEIVPFGGHQEIGQTTEIVFQRLLVKRNTSETQKIIFEVVQVPGNRLTVKAPDGIARFIIHIAAGFDLKARQDRYNFSVGFYYRWGNRGGIAIFR